MIFYKKGQRGLTFISFMLILGLLAFFVLLTLKISPIYINHNKITNALSALEQMEEIETMSQNEIRTSLRKRFDMNYVDKFKASDVVILKQSDYLKVEVEYEQVEKILGNLSVLVKFYDFFEIGDDR